MTLGLSSHISYQHLPSLCTNQQYLYKSSYNQLSKTPGCLMEQGNWANSFPHLQCQPAMKTILYYYYIPHGLLTIIKHQLIKHQWRYVPQRPSRSSHLQMCEDFVLNFYLKINWWIRWLNSGWVFFGSFLRVSTTSIPTILKLTIPNMTIKFPIFLPIAQYDRNVRMRQNLSDFCVQIW